MPARKADDEFWVFGYGSLLWKPGFDYVERQLATLDDYRRSFCMHSVHYRGTHETPGLVLALDPSAGRSCRGVGFRVGAADASETLAYLRDRELVSAAYLEQWHPIRLETGDTVTAVCYVMDRDHDQYCGELSLSEQARIIARARGQFGPNDAYLYNTVEHLEALGIADPELQHLAKLVKAAN